jgi:hypothetical protein
MAVTADRVVVELFARTDKFNADISSATATFERAMGRQDAAAQKSEQVRLGAVDRIVAAIREASSQQIAALQSSTAAVTQAATETTKAADATAVAVAGSTDRIINALSKRAAAATGAANEEAEASGRSARTRKAEADQEVQLTARQIAQRLRLQQQIRGAAATTQNAAGVIVRSSGQAEFAAKNLGFQLGDIGAQLGGGTSPFVIIAQQGPQVTQALQDIAASGARLGTVLKTIALPGFIAVASVALTFAQNLRQGANAADTKKKATDALKDATDRLIGASASANKQTVIGIQNDIAAAERLRNREIRTRGLIQAELDLAVARQEAILAGARSGEPGSEANSLIAPFAEREVKRLTGLINEQYRKIGEASRAIDSGRAQLVLREVAGAADAATGATQRYNDEIDRLTRKFESGGFGSGAAAEQAFGAAAAAATRARDRTISAIGDQRRAERAAAVAREREAKATANQWQDVLDSANAAGVAIAKASNGIKAPDFSADLRDFRKLLDENRKEAFATNTAEGRQQLQEDLRNRKEGIKTLAGLYENLFNGGSASIADTFKRLMTKALAEALAKKTFNSLFGSSGILKDLGGLIGIAGPSSTSTDTDLFFGRASGGYVAPHSTVRVNEGRGGVELLRMGGQGGTVIPLGQANAATSGGTVVTQTLSFDLSGAVLTADLLAQMNAMADRAAMRGAAGGSQMAQAAMARRGKYALGR